MNVFDAQYKKLLEQVRHAPLKPTRQGIDAHMLPGATFKHHLSEGFPLTTLRKVTFGLVASELQFNLLGLTDKKWLQDKGNHIWDDWCDPTIVPYATDPSTKERMRAERDLGPLYGFQWRHFGAMYEGYGSNYVGKGIDQITCLLETLKKNPESKRMVVSCWNPSQMEHQAIPPCPFAFQIVVNKGELDLFLYQRSVDILLGFPFDFAGYALLLQLLAQEVALQPGTITAYFGNVELYENQEIAADALLTREISFTLSNIETSPFTSLLAWNCEDSRLIHYSSHPSLKIPIAV